jgi:hypothetical protein
MWPFSYILHCLKRLLTSQIGAVVVFILVLYVVKNGTVWRVLRRVGSAVTSARQRFGRLSLPFGQPPSHMEGGRAAWELRKDCIGVYSIQGRRPHMEDRFNVVELEQMNTSIFGVFDGHGGQVRIGFGH